ncbi:MAG: hypothetical protein ACPLRW_07355 [Moorellales bacterium]
MRAKKKLALVLVAVLLVAVFGFFPGRAGAAGSWTYGVTTVDTPLYIDPSATTAEVDTTANEIRLPRTGQSGGLAFLPAEGIEYAVLTTSGVKVFSFDGSRMVENPVLSVGGISNPVALATSPQYPDVVVATPDAVRHYSFAGSGMAENPALSVGGLTDIMSVGVKEGDVAVLAGGQVKRYLFTGTGMEEAAVLEPQTSFANPVAVALSEGYDVAVLEKDRVRFFQFTGSGMAENPALAVTGLSGAVAFAVSGYEVAVVDGGQIKHYSFDGSRLVYNQALSVTSGLVRPAAVALRPGYFDRIVLDGTRVRYYSFDGVRMVENPALSVDVPDAAAGGSSYAPSAVAVSRPVDPGTPPATHVRVRAYHVLPEGTSVTWSVTADGTNWVKKWRVRGTPSGAVLEVSPDNGLTWSLLGDASLASPAADTAELWAVVPQGRQVRWKAELATADPTKTPVIKAIGGVAVKWEAGRGPSVVLDPVPNWVYTTTPSFSWRFIDPDPGDTQSAFQLVVKRQADGAAVYDSGKVAGGSTSFTLPTSYAPDVPGPLWASGDYRFTVQVRVWDGLGIPSDWSAARAFNVLAFERPRIKELAVPAVGQTAPDPADEATHIVIRPGMAAGELPATKAGGRVTLAVDSVGPIEALAARFPYLATEATVGQISRLNPPGSPVNRWEIPFWTAAGLQDCPSGTVVGMHLVGTRPGDYTEFGTVPGSTTHGTLNYAAGVVRTEGSAYETWFVVLEGRRRE